MTEEVKENIDKVIELWSTVSDVAVQMTEGKIPYLPFEDVIRLTGVIADYLTAHGYNPTLMKARMKE